LANAFVARPEFLVNYPASQTLTEFVDAVLLPIRMTSRDLHRNALPSSVWAVAVRDVRLADRQCHEPIAIGFHRREYNLPSSILNTLVICGATLTWGFLYG